MSSAKQNGFFRCFVHAAALKAILPGLFLVAVLAAGCKRNEPPADGPVQFVEIFVRYLTPENEYKAQVMFLEGDSLGAAQPKRLPGGLSWDGSAMREKPVGSGVFRYELIKAGPYKPRHKFEFSDNQGLRRSLTAEMHPITGFRIGPSISRSADATLRLEGKPLAEGETLLLLFTNAQGATHSLSFKGPAASNTFTLKREMLDALEPGKHELYLIRQQQRETRQQQRVVYSTVEWYSPVMELEVKD